MAKLAKLGVAWLLGLLMALTLVVPGAFAQRVDVLQGSTPSTHQVVLQQTNASTPQHSAWWGPGWGWGGWGWDGWWGPGWGWGWGGCSYWC